MKLVLPPALKTVLKYSLSIACLVYVLWGIDIQNLLNSFHALSLHWLIVAQVIILVTFIPTGYRLIFLSGQRATLKTAIKATAMTVAGNTIFPARLGEIVKVIVLKQDAMIPTEQSLSIVFWERFADLNYLLCIGALVAIGAQLPLTLIPLLTIVAIAWSGLVCLRLRPQWIHALISIIPSERLHCLGTKTLTTLAGFLKGKLLLGLALYTVATWALFGLGIYVALTLGAGLHLTVTQVAIVFVAGVLGIAIPSAPAAIGVYETFVVSALTLCGVAQAQALAITLILHLMQTLLPTLLGLSFMPGFSFKSKEIQQAAFKE
ncbi:MAG: flippase-like domain-containing protein [Pseudodesulfovibrio sp.]